MIRFFVWTLFALSLVAWVAWFGDRQIGTLRAGVGRLAEKLAAVVDSIPHEKSQTQATDSHPDVRASGAPKQEDFYGAHEARTQDVPPERDPTPARSAASGGHPLEAARAPAQPHRESVVPAELSAPAGSDDPAGLPAPDRWADPGPPDPSRFVAHATEDRSSLDAAIRSLNEAATRLGME